MQEIPHYCVSGVAGGFWLEKGVFECFYIMYISRPHVAFYMEGAVYLHTQILAQNIYEALDYDITCH